MHLSVTVSNSLGRGRDAAFMERLHGLAREVREGSLFWGAWLANLTFQRMTHRNHVNFEAFPHTSVNFLIDHTRDLLAFSLKPPSC